jgi:hypothetical protein
MRFLTMFVVFVVSLAAFAAVGTALGVTRWAALASAIVVTWAVGPQAFAKVRAWKRNVDDTRDSESGG